MSAKIIDGVAVARGLRKDCRKRIEALHERSGVSPGLAVILVGSDPASCVYVRNKVRACAEVGIGSQVLTFAESVGQAEIVQTIEKLNHDPQTHGILVQLPTVFTSTMSAA